MSKESSYKSIFKSTSIFGGVQVINIVISIFRSKIIAIFLGATGMGIASLLNSTVTLIGTMTDFGLASSSIKNVAEAYNDEDKDKFPRTVFIFNRLIWFTGLFGAISMLIFSSVLSKLAFGNGKYTIAFVVLSITMIFNQLKVKDSVLLRGIRRVRSLANASILGAFLGLVISLPLYYYWGISGIVPGIIITSILGFAVNRYYARSINVNKVNVSKLDFRVQATDMLKMGFFISLSGLISIGCSYIIRIYIRKTGSVSDVGLYSAGFAIIGTYVGMVFTAMATDYYPRLSMVSNDNLKCKNEINQQAEIAILILAPILIVFLLFIKWIIILLYSKEFVGIVTMVQWAALGMFFKGVSWAIGFIFLAKGASKTFFWNELASSVYMLILNIIGYHYGGLTGLGISYLVSYFIHYIQMHWVSRNLYSFDLDKNLIKIFLIQLIYLTFCFILINFLPPFYAYTIGIIFCFLSIRFSWIELNKLIGINDIIRKRFIKK